MFFRQLSKSPSDKKKRDSTLIDFAKLNPFPGRPATATPDNPPSRLFGRDTEMDNLEKIVISAFSPNRPLTIIQGETGMGKSAITSYLFNKIKKGELDNDGLHIYATFIEAYGEVKDFRLLNFYLQMIRSLERFGMLSKIVVRMIQMIGKIIYEESAKDFRELFGDWDPYEISNTHRLLSDRKTVENFIENFVNSLGLFYPQIQSKWPHLNDGLIKTLIYSQSVTIKRINALEALQRGNKFGDYQINTDAEAKEALNTLISLLIAINKKSVLVLFIDQLEELFEIVDPKKISMKVFTLLLTLRQVPNLSIILSGNLQAYDHLTSNLVGDTATQLEHWHTYLYIHRLSGNEVGSIVHYLLSEFWRSYDMTIDVKFPYYPLSGETISYLYQKYDQNLRRTLIGLHDIFVDFKENQEVKDLTDPISAISDLNILHDPLILPLKMQQDFANHMVSDGIQDKTRSEIPEKAIYKLMKIVMENLKFISDLSMSPTMRITGKKPDIFYRLGGNLYHSDARRIGIEVKCYRKGKVISNDNVKKTIVMLEKGDLDYIIWVTNVELHKDTIESIPQELRERHIGITPQTSEQLAYTYWAFIFEEAMKRKPRLDEALFLLEKIGIPKTFVEDPDRLIATENMRKERLIIKDSELQIEPKEAEKMQLPIEDFLDDSISDTNNKKIISIDMHDRMREFVISHVELLISNKRKQINKTKFFEIFLEKEGITKNDLPETEFIEILETIAKTNDKMRTTQKMLMLKY